jgi:hypothetical protein
MSSGEREALPGGGSCPPGRAMSDKAALSDVPSAATCQGWCEYFALLAIEVELRNSYCIYLKLGLFFNDLMPFSRRFLLRTDSSIFFKVLLSNA